MKMFAKLKRVLAGVLALTALIMVLSACSDIGFAGNEEDSVLFEKSKTAALFKQLQNGYTVKYDDVMKFNSNALAECEIMYVTDSTDSYEEFKEDGVTYCYFEKLGGLGGYYSLNKDEHTYNTVGGSYPSILNGLIPRVEYKGKTLKTGTALSCYSETLEFTTSTDDELYYGSGKITYCYDDADDLKYVMYSYTTETIHNEATMVIKTLSFTYDASLLTLSGYKDAVV